MTLTWDELTLSPDASSWEAAPVRWSWDVTRIYLRGGRHAHLREAIDSTGCGGRDGWRRGDWLGTGSQHEYETAARMPLCPHCFGWREAGIADDPRLGIAHGTDLRDYPGDMPPPDQQPIVAVPASCPNCGNPATQLRIQAGTWRCPRCGVSGTSPAGVH